VEACIIRLITRLRISIATKGVRDMTELTAHDINVGNVVFYLLREKDQPVDVDKLWRGEVVKVNACSVVVESLEPGYGRAREVVFFSQIVSMIDRTVKSLEKSEWLLVGAIFGSIDYERAERIIREGMLAELICALPLSYACGHVHLFDVGSLPITLVEFISALREERLKICPDCQERGR
jgi:hypothetical protein